MFDRLYQKTLSYARHKRAVWYLAALSFAESSFAPVPPDFLLAPMALAQPRRALRLAGLTTLASVLGGIFGYGLGYFFFALLEPWLKAGSYFEAYLQAREWFTRLGFWAVLVAGFSPIPYKAFTLAAGTLAMDPLGFVLASLLGRGGRFFLVAGLIAWGGERLEQTIYRKINYIGWAAVAALGLGGIVYYWFR